MCGGPRVVLSTAAFHARVRGSFPGLGGMKETKIFLPHPLVELSIVGSLRDREMRVPVYKSLTNEIKESIKTDKEMAWQEQIGKLDGARKRTEFWNSLFRLTGAWGAFLVVFSRFPVT